MKIKGRELGNGKPPYIVAEIGANHGGSLDRCLELIRAAKEAGADAVKFQAYTADTITIKSNLHYFWINDGPWQGQNLYDLYKKCETPFEWFPVLAAYADYVGITWFASVFDPSSVDMLEKLDCPAYKIASFEIVDLPLIQYAASKRKPMLISTGMASPAETQQAIGACWDGGNSNVICLHCVSGYPSSPKDYNLLHTQYSHGVSDHTTTLEVPIASTALGMQMIEKHFCLDGCCTDDAKFSLTPDKFKEMVQAVHNTWQALQPTENKAVETSQRNFRRSLYVVKEVAKGELFTPENVRSIRPGGGLPPADIDKVIGKRAKKYLSAGMPMQWEMVEG